MLTTSARRWLVGGVTAAAFITAASVATTTIVLGSHPAGVALRPAAATAPATPKATHKAVPAKPAPPKPTQAKTVYVTPPPAQVPAQTPYESPAPVAPAPSSPQLTNGVSVVLQYYQDITDNDYSAAWAIGGSNLAAQTGQTYSSWESGYSATTASIAVTSSGTWSDGTVWTDISAVQLDGSVRTYHGTYTVSGGVIASANMTRTS